MITDRIKKIARDIYKDEIVMVKEENRNWNFQKIVWEVMNTIDFDDGYLAEENIDLGLVEEYLFSIKNELEIPDTQDQKEYEENMIKRDELLNIIKKEGRYISFTKEELLKGTDIVEITNKCGIIFKVYGHIVQNKENHNIKEYRLVVLKEKSFRTDGLSDFSLNKELDNLNIYINLYNCN